MDEWLVGFDRSFDVLMDLARSDDGDEVFDLDNVDGFGGGSGCSGESDGDDDANESGDEDFGDEARVDFDNDFDESLSRLTSMRDT